ncbi:STB2 protein [Plectosphaerella plurivora]|uniref:STB2 protein n=1 Tax=Plectosphaerella plurivora TaxID=936078 RepID=A0A9P8VGV0_9PEZI|nr:STB2 protein [Plectosphaerella plurivora]
MSFRFPFPPDPWTHREEDYTLSRTSSNFQSKRNGNAETPAATGIKRESTNEGLTASPVPIARRNLALADPIAFRYLEDDPTVNVVKRRGTLPGYELYLVEQWACSRESPTLVVATYTGDEKHSIVVSILGVPEDERDWSPRLRAYFRAIQQYHARPKETELGELMVTNLSSFPSALTVILVPDGDIRAHRQAFIVNENLKRLGCSGRSGMTLADPTPATQAKFYQLYKTSDRIPFFESVLELVKLCQTALFLFGKLDFDFLDGLLCDKTEAAVGNWWTEVGAEYYNIEPTDGILGPTTVASLLGMLMGARNRLHYLGAPVVKDAFDIANTKRGVSWFQKVQKLEKTRRLDRQTILKLHTVTAKAAAGEGWGVQKAVKSTVAEIGGKRGELVIGMVGGRDKGAIGDIETREIDKFIDLTSGERAKWLWHGKPKRDKMPVDNTETGPDMGAILFGGKEEAAAADQATKRTQSLPLEEEMQRTKEEPAPFVSPAVPISAVTIGAETPSGDRDREAMRKGMFKSVAGRVNDAKSGLGRIKDTIGGSRKGHTSRPSRDDFSDNGYSSHSISTLAQNSAIITSPTGIGRAFTWKNKPEEYLEAFKKDAKEARDASDLLQEREAAMEGASSVDGEPPQRTSDTSNKIITEAIEEEPADEAQHSVIGSTVETDLLGPLAAERAENTAVSLLQRRHSFDSALPPSPLNDARWPRRLSFGDMEEAVLRWEDIVDVPAGEVVPLSDPAAALLQAAALASYSQALHAEMGAVRASVAPWVQAKLAGVEALDTHFGREQEELQTLYYQLSQASEHLKQGAVELIASERGRVTEAVKEVEVLVARLEYEMNALASKVQDVEDGVALFERQVEAVEARAEELKATLEKEGWLHWLVRTLTGIGTGPNITAERGAAAVAAPAPGHHA